MEFNNIYMANPDQKTILIKQTTKEIIEICKKFQDDTGSSNSEVKNSFKRISYVMGN